MAHLHRVEQAHAYSIYLMIRYGARSNGVPAQQFMADIYRNVPDQMRIRQLQYRLGRRMWQRKPY